MDVDRTRVVAAPTLRRLLVGDLERIFFRPEEIAGREQTGAEQDKAEFASHAGHVRASFAPKGRCLLEKQYHPTAKEARVQAPDRSMAVACGMLGVWD
jgi:hypothetical protein